MKKMIISFLVAGLLSLGLAGLSFAAVVLYEEGTQVGTVEKVNIIGDGVTAAAAGKTGSLTFTGTSATPTITGGTINGAIIGGSTPAAGAFTTLTASGNADVAGTFKAGTTDAFSVGATGIIIDTSLYATTSGTGANRTVCVDSDGKIFSSAAACP